MDFKFQATLSPLVACNPSSVCEITWQFRGAWLRLFKSQVWNGGIFLCFTVLSPVFSPIALSLSLSKPSFFLPSYTPLPQSPAVLFLSSPGCNPPLWSYTMCYIVSRKMPMFRLNTDVHFVPVDNEKQQMGFWTLVVHTHKHSDKEDKHTHFSLWGCSLK